MIALVDCNNFYCSCERVFQPDLLGRPLVVLSNNDGCIIARSAEVKALGIAMGTPLFKVRDVVRRHGIVVRSSNYTLYGDMSHRVMRTLERFSPAVEVYSIDEAFVYLDVQVDLAAHARRLRQTVGQHTGIPVSVGIGPSKTLAKVANKHAKRTDGVALADTPARQTQMLAVLDVEDVWGVGRRLGRRLRRAGVNTALLLRDADLRWVRKQFNVTLQQTVLELRGQRCFPAEFTPAPARQIVRSRSFSRPVRDLAELEQAAAMHATRAAEKLRAQHLSAGLLGVFIMTNRLKTDQPQYSNSATLRLAVPSDATDTLIAAALRGLRRIYRTGYAFNKAGVMLMNLSSADTGQPNLFPELDQPQSSPLDATLDAINQRFGQATLRYAAVGTNHPWAMQRNHCSPRYTTAWSDLPKAKT